MLLLKRFGLWLPLLLSAFFIFLLPNTTTAAPGLVSCGLSDANGNLIDQCQLCDLVILIQKVIDFIILQLAAPVATLLIAYAGIRLMIFAESEGERTKAKQLFMDILVGFLFILLAWAIVVLILNILVKETKSPDSKWFEIACDKTNYGAPNVQLDQAPNVLLVITPTGIKGAITQVKAQELLNGFATSKKTVVWEGASPYLIDEVKYAKALCQSCEIIVNSVRDGVHSTSGEFTHANGYKVDLGANPKLISSIQSSPQFEATGTRSDGALLYKNKSTGAVWALEGLNTKNAHIDIQVTKKI